MLSAYANDIVSLGESEAEIATCNLKLIENSEKIGLRVNVNKTKYPIVTRKPTIIQSLRVRQYLFEQVKVFKYLETNINQRNSMHNEVKLR